MKEDNFEKSEVGDEGWAGGEGGKVGFEQQAVQVGSDADITIFNPNTIIDKATFEKGLAFSEGVEYVIVNGTVVLKNGKTVTDTFPGQLVWGKFKKQ